MAASLVGPVGLEPTTYGLKDVSLRCRLVPPNTILSASAASRQARDDAPCQPVVASAVAKRVAEGAVENRDGKANVTDLCLFVIGGSGSARLSGAGPTEQTPARPFRPSGACSTHRGREGFPEGGRFSELGHAAAAVPV